MNARSTPLALRLAAAFALAGSATVEAQVTFERILAADREPENWLSYSGTPFNQRYSLLDQVTRANVAELELAWVWQARSLEKFEATALVVDGVLYTVQAPNDVVALDAATGRPFWTYHHEPSAAARTCCGRVNRGVAILGDRLFMGTIDAHLLAIDAKSGQLVWDATVADAAQNYSITMAPVIEGQGIGRHGGRRHGHPRFHRGVRCCDGRRGMALPYDSGAR
jgi:glucose dehydrogenase